MAKIVKIKKDTISDFKLWFSIITFLQNYTQHNNKCVYTYTHIHIHTQCMYYTYMDGFHSTDSLLAMSILCKIQKPACCGSKIFDMSCNCKNLWFTSGKPSWERPALLEIFFYHWRYSRMKNSPNSHTLTPKNEQTPRKYEFPLKVIKFPKMASFVFCQLLRVTVTHFWGKIHVVHRCRGIQRG